MLRTQSSQHTNFIPRFAATNSNAQDKRPMPQMHHRTVPNAHNRSREERAHHERLDVLAYI